MKTHTTRSIVEARRPSSASEHRGSILNLANTTDAQAGNAAADPARGYSQRTRMPSQIARGAAGETAFSFGQLLGLAMNVPFGLNELLVKNPAVEYSLSNRLVKRAKTSACFVTW